MIDIIANIKIEENKPDRVNYFLSCLQSFFNIHPNQKFIINLENPSDNLYGLTKKLLQKSGNKFHLQKTINATKSYGYNYIELIRNYSENNLIVNFIEDHYRIIDTYNFCNLLRFMQVKNVDVCKATFFKIEQIYSKNLLLTSNTIYGKVFINDLFNYKKYDEIYEHRYYIGVNFITTKNFALKFWNRDCGNRPHEYELDTYNESFKHICMIPNMEILISVEDPHGLPGTCLLKRRPDLILTQWK